MNSINLVISGNLTGFSRFFASSGANEILNEIKFDFDYRNFLTFLNSGEKAYVVSFAPTVIAVSLVTRLLDSFRRPGVLVVTLLLPRRGKVESAMNPQNKNALYQLLNEINDKFYERNFVNGMVNQNAAVLMQDYYSDILANYVLASDGMQRNINATIDVESPNKRLGYVQTSEANVPLYLATPCRRSYEGCHHVFFAQKPVQNLIAEEPVEVVYYRVQVTNNRQTLSSVTLNDKIPNIRPEEGEIDIDKNFTYQQVLNGEAGRNITAILNGETLEITYRFGLEEKTIKFIFNEDGKDIPFTSIMPVLESNGTVINIPSETYTFQGKEIYGPKRIKSRGTEYQIKRESETLDLRRISDTCVIQVEHCFPLKLYFHSSESNPKKMVFKSAYASYTFNVTDSLDEVLSGYPEDYVYSVESLYYEKVTGSLPSAGSHFNIELKPIKKTVVSGSSANSRASDNVNNSGAKHIQEAHYGTNGNAKSEKTYARSTPRRNGGTIQLNGGDSSQYPPLKPKDNKYKKMPIVAGALAVCILYLVLSYRFEFFPFSKSSSSTGVTETVEEYDKNIRFSYIDADGDTIKSNDISYDRFMKNVKLEISPDEQKTYLGPKKDGDIGDYYQLSGDLQDILEYIIKVNLSDEKINEDLVIKTEELTKESFDTIIFVKLKIRVSEIKLYGELIEKSNNKEKISKVKRDDYQTKIDKIDGSLGRTKEFLRKLLNILDVDEGVDIKKETPKEESKSKAGDKSEKNTRPQTDSSKLPEEVKQRIEHGDIITSGIMETIENAKHQEILKKYNAWHEKTYKNYEYKMKEKVKKQLSDCSTYSELSTVVKNNIIKKE